jgi:hypothetical protein
MPNGQTIFLNKSVVQVNPFFAAFNSFAEDGIIEIASPDPETLAFVLECIYLFSIEERVVKVDEVMIQGSVDWYILGVLRNASFLFMTNLLSRYYFMYVILLKSDLLRFPGIWNTGFSRSLQPKIPLP